MLLLAAWNARGHFVTTGAKQHGFQPGGSMEEHVLTAALHVDKPMWMVNVFFPTGFVE